MLISKSDHQKSHSGCAMGTGKHGFVNDLLGSESYFCKPYSSWEKGGVENYNGLVRQYFPKGSDFSGITQEQLQEVEDEINNRPRNILGYESPNDLLHEMKAS
ncbi:IS30 family transposase [Akkermansiaceae bacterium]|nr:IS30 family transposase [Akkermansiaceae bacterium]MDC0275102.1 IS30 family transposase [Akkermansiaceae bacterium]